MAVMTGHYQDAENMLLQATRTKPYLIKMKSNSHKEESIVLQTTNKSRPRCQKNLLLQAGLVFRAVLLNVYLHQWERALDLAVKVQTDICCENIVDFLMER